MESHLGADEIKVTVLMNKSFKEFSHDTNIREEFLNDLASFTNCPKETIRDIHFWDACITWQATFPYNPAEKLLKLWGLLQSKIFASVEVIELQSLAEKHSVTAIYSAISESFQQSLVDLVTDARLIFSTSKNLEDISGQSMDEVTMYNSPPYSDLAEEAYMKKQSELFQKSKENLLKEYLGLHVYFEDGKVIDADKDPVKLVKRAYEKGGVRPLFIKHVLSGEETQPEIWSFVPSY